MWDTGCRDSAETGRHDYPCRVPLSRRALLSAAALSVVAAGCAPVEDIATPTRRRFDNVAPAREVTWWTSTPTGEELIEEALAMRFTNANPELRVVIRRFEDQPSLMSEYEATAPAARPDLFTINSNAWFDLMQRRAILPLNELLTYTAAPSGDLRVPLVNAFMHEGEIWGLPFVMSIPAMYFNRDHWAKAQLPDNSPPLWSDLTDWATLLRQANPEVPSVYADPLLTPLAPWLLQSRLWALDGALSEGWQSRITDPQTIAALRYPQTAAAEGWLTTPDDPIQSLLDGEVSIAMGTVTDLPRVVATGANIGIGGVPGARLSGVTATVGGSGLAISSERDRSHQLTAAMFLRHTIETTISVPVARWTGAIPVRMATSVNDIVEPLAPMRHMMDLMLPNARQQDFFRTRLPGADAHISAAFAASLTGDIPTIAADLDAALQMIFDEQVQPNL
ncbi:hypothetical protein CGZ92_12505 [Parenemella sanctibonifatiensis]|uniref:Extracellular solute-binding protein n=1 Tax=Parenemella sanctibonifatiensis TaxID=2016505 RepID=A0A255DZB6_9ACTN|nr:hypothetical protein CGZ92_12505 [Parenemella sanctibonifatiensis]